MRIWLVGIVVSVVSVAGCSNPHEPVAVTGVVKTAAGKPVTGVRLILAPVNGSTLGTVGFPLDADGHFAGEALPGPYNFYLARASVQTDDEGQPANIAEAKKLREANRAYKTIPAPYRTEKGAGPDRQV